MSHVVCLGWKFKQLLIRDEEKLFIAWVVNRQFCTMILSGNLKMFKVKNRGEMWKFLGSKFIGLHPFFWRIVRSLIVFLFWTQTRLP